MEEHATRHPGIEEASKETASVRINHDKTNMLADDKFLQRKGEVARIQRCKLDVAIGVVLLVVLHHGAQLNLTPVFRNSRDVEEHVIGLIRLCELYHAVEEHEVSLVKPCGYPYIFYIRKVYHLGIFWYDEYRYLGAVNNLSGNGSDEIFVASALSSRTHDDGDGRTVACC